MARILRGTVLRLEPTAAQAEMLADMANARRLAWNAATVLCDELFDGAVPADYARAEDSGEKSPWRFASRNDLVVMLGRMRNAAQFGTVERVPAKLVEAALADLLAATARWRDDLHSGTRRRSGKPGFISAIGSDRTFRVSVSGGAVGGLLYIPHVSGIRVSGSTRQIERVMRQLDGRIRAVTVRFEHGYWRASLLMEREQKAADRFLSEADLGDYEHRADVAGGDMGLTTLLTLSDGLEIPNLRFLRRGLTRIRRIGKEISRAEEDRRLKAWRLAVAHDPVKWSAQADILRRCPTTGSGLSVPPAYWLGKVRRSHRLDKLYDKLRRAHERVANQRDNYLSEIAVLIAERYGILGLETLRISNLMANHKLARAIGDAGWGMLAKKIESAIEDRGGLVVRHDAFFPSTQLCSGVMPDGSPCVARMKLDLSVRVYECPRCGLVIGRDVNASVNLRPTREQALAAIKAQAEKRTAYAETQRKRAEAATKAAITNRAHAARKRERREQARMSAPAGRDVPANVDAMPVETQNRSGERGAGGGSHGRKAVATVPRRSRDAAASAALPGRTASLAEAPQVQPPPFAGSG
jgi:putative transposase